MSASNKPTIEKKLKNLEAIIGWFESNDVNIDKALEKYEEGMKLAQELQQDLKTVENKFTKIQKSFSKEK